VLKKFTSKKFHENPSSGRQVVPRERADMTKLTQQFFATFGKRQKN